MSDAEVQPLFVSALRRVVLHLIMNGQPWYAELLPWLSAADRGDWGRLDDEMKLAHLNELESNVLFRREGLGEFFGGSDVLDRSLFQELALACEAYRKHLRRWL